MNGQHTCTRRNLSCNDRFVRWPFAVTTTSSPHCERNKCIAIKIHQTSIWVLRLHISVSRILGLGFGFGRSVEWEDADRRSAVTLTRTMATQCWKALVMETSPTANPSTQRDNLRNRPVWQRPLINGITRRSVQINRRLSDEKFLLKLMSMALPNVIFFKSPKQKH